MRDYLLGVLSAVVYGIVAAIALAWRHGMRYHEVTGEQRERPAAVSPPAASSQVAAQPLPAKPPTAAWPAVAAPLNTPQAVPAFLFQPNVTLADALKAAYERGRVDGRAASVLDDYNAGRADAVRLLGHPSLN